MSAETLLSRLAKVRRTGHGRWIACCPAHEDRSPSLSVRELGDGRLLAHCFGGCDTGAVLDAVGLSFEDLFPEPLSARLPSASQALPAADILRCLAGDLTIAAVLVADAARGAALSDESRTRLWTVAGRVADAVEALT